MLDAPDMKFWAADLRNWLLDSKHLPYLTTSWTNPLNRTYFPQCSGLISFAYSATGNRNAPTTGSVKRRPKQLSRKVMFSIWYAFPVDIKREDHFRASQCDNLSTPPPWKAEAISGVAGETEQPGNDERILCTITDNGSPPFTRR